MADTTATLQLLDDETCNKYCMVHSVYVHYLRALSQIIIKQ